MGVKYKSYLEQYCNKCKNLLAYLTIYLTLNNLSIYTNTKQKE